MAVVDDVEDEVDTLQDVLEGKVLEPFEYLPAMTVWEARTAADPALGPVLDEIAEKYSEAAFLRWTTLNKVTIQTPSGLGLDMKPALSEKTGSRLVGLYWVGYVDLETNTVVWDREATKKMISYGLFSKPR